MGFSANTGAGANSKAYKNHKTQWFRGRGSPSLLRFILPMVSFHSHRGGKCSPCVRQEQRCWGTVPCQGWQGEGAPDVERTSGLSNTQAERTHTRSRGVGLGFLLGLLSTKFHKSIRGSKQAFGLQLPNSYAPLPTQPFHWLKPKATWLLRWLNNALFWPLCRGSLWKGITCFMVNHFTPNHLVLSWTPRPAWIGVGAVSGLGQHSSVQVAVDGIVLGELLL